MSIPNTPPSIWWQACYYKDESNTPWKSGLAKMRHGPDLYDVVLIIDSDGNKIKQVYNYQLIPASHERATAICIAP